MNINFLNFKINSNYSNITVREFLQLHNVSKKNITKQDMFNLIRINDKLARLTDRIKKGDTLSFKLAPLDGLVEAYDGRVQIVYEDEDIVVVNKPPKLLIHEDGNTKNTLTNRLAAHYQNRGYSSPVLPVHRIDFDISGIVVFAKHFISLSYLSNQFEERNVEKTYVAITDHYFKNKESRIVEKIGKDRHSNNYIVTDGGKEARTDYFVMEQANDRSKVELKTIGDRSHQVRVHLAHIGHPIVGDKKYGKTPHERILLHFKEIKFIHPRTKEQVKFKIKEPF